METRFDTQDYIHHALVMLLQMLDHKKLMKKKEIREMFYTEHAAKAIFSVIIREYNITHISQKLRHLAYLILGKIIRIDIDEARKSFRIWSHNKENKNKLFERIISLANQFSTYFINKELFKDIIYNLDLTYYKELVLSLKWLTLLLKNDKKMQDYMTNQDNSSRTHNLILPIIELMRVTVNSVNSEYVLDLWIVVVNFIIETINAKNHQYINQYASSGILKYSFIVLQCGLTKSEREFMSAINGKEIPPFQSELD